MSSSTPSASATSGCLSVLPSPSIQLARAMEFLDVQSIPSLSALELFQSQLASASAEAHTDAMKRLSVVAVSLGVTDAQQLLIPYLVELGTSSSNNSGGNNTSSSNANSMPKDVLLNPSNPNANANPTTCAAAQQSDELLLILGQELIPVALWMGVDSIPLWLPLVERLATTEETVVREQAVVIFDAFCHMQPPAAQIPLWMAICKRLAAADWFTPKVSACGIIAATLKVVVDNNQKNNNKHANAAAELLALYSDLAGDETPMVRRAAAKHLGPVLARAGPPANADSSNNNPVLASLQPLCRDEQDSVRLLAIGALAQVGPLFGNTNESAQWTAVHWLPLVKEGSTDMSWRVRHNLAKNFAQVAQNLGFQNDPARWTAEQDLVMACLVSLLTDVEAEVRAAAVAHLATMTAWGGAAHFATHVQPLLPALADDVVMEVRSKCALALMDCAHGGVLEDTLVLATIGPLLESFLQDEFQEVQLQVLQNLDKISHLLPALSQVVQALLQMSVASNWRVRQAVGTLLPHLAEARGLDFFATVLLEPSWMTLLLDSVATVRQSIVTGVQLLCQVAGPEWIHTKLLPAHEQLYANHSYLIRVTILLAHVQVAQAFGRSDVLGAAEPATRAVEFLHQAAQRDPVPNVRLVAARGLAQFVASAQQHSSNSDSNLASRTAQFLQDRLAEETDEDVRYVLEQAALEPTAAPSE